MDFDFLNQIRAVHHSFLGASGVITLVHLLCLAKFQLQCFGFVLHFSLPPSDLNGGIMLELNNAFVLCFCSAKKRNSWALFRYTPPFCAGQERALFHNRVVRLVVAA